MSLKIRDSTMEAEAAFRDGVVTLTTASGATTWGARPAGDARWVLTRDGLSHVVFIAKDRGNTWIHVHGRAWLVQRAEAAARPADAGSLVAPMTGKVLEVLVTEGASVTEGQPLMVLSAMKMRLEIKAPRAGVVRRLPAAGGQVEGGDILAVVDAAP